jgi:hypothetical protein
MICNLLIPFYAFSGNLNIAAKRLILQHDSLLKYRSQTYHYYNRPDNGKIKISVRLKNDSLHWYDSLSLYKAVKKRKKQLIVYYREVDQKVMIGGMYKLCWDDPGNTKRKSRGWIYVPAGTWRYYDEKGKLIAKKKQGKCKRKKRNRIHDQNPEF